MPEVTAKLIAHAGATPISREDLNKIAAPARTNSFVPVRHGDLIDTVETSMTRLGMEVADWKFAVSHDGNRLFSTMRMKAAEADYAFAVGLRTANDRSMALNMVSGANVFVCDNMAFSGELVTLKRKHTSRLDLGREVSDACARAVSKFDGVRKDVIRLKEFSLENKDALAKSIIFDAANKGVIAWNLAGKVYEEYVKPTHEDFTPRNLWSLHNAFTEKFKELRPHLAMEASIQLGAMFRIGAA